MPDTKTITDQSRRAGGGGAADKMDQQRQTQQRDRPQAKGRKARCRQKTGTKGRKLGMSEHPLWLERACGKFNLCLQQYRG